MIGHFNFYKEREKYVPEKFLLILFSQILKGLNYAHSRKVFHQDIKPDNIFLTENSVKLGDFGVSRILASTSGEV